MLAEMVGRALKNMLRAVLRDQHLREPSEFLSRRKVVQFLNLISGSHPNAREFWRDKVPIEVMARFGQSALLSPTTSGSSSSGGGGARTHDGTGTGHAEMDERQSLFTVMLHGRHLPRLLKYVLSTGGIQITSACDTAFEPHPQGFVFVSSDLALMTVRIKHMSVIGRSHLPTIDCLTPVRCADSLSLFVGRLC